MRAFSDISLYSVIVVHRPRWCSVPLYSPMRAVTSMMPTCATSPTMSNLRDSA
jgi:hypothetical protein